MKNIQILFMVFCTSGLMFSSHEGREFNYNIEGKEHKSLADIQKEMWERLSPEEQADRIAEQNDRIRRQNIERQNAEDKDSHPFTTKNVLKPEDRKFKMDFTDEDEAEDRQREERNREWNKWRKQEARNKQEEEQGRISKEAQNKAESKSEGFDFTDDENESKSADPKDVSTWTEENVEKIASTDFANLKVEDLKKLLKNQKLLEKLSSQQVQAIKPDELAKIIDGHIGTRIMQWAGKGIDKLPESFVAKMSSKQAKAIIENEASKGMFTVSHFKDYFSEKSRNYLEKLAKSFKNENSAPRKLLRESDNNEAKKIEEANNLTSDKINKMNEQELRSYSDVMDKLDAKIKAWLEQALQKIDLQKKNQF